MLLDRALPRGIGELRRGEVRVWRRDPKAVFDAQRSRKWIRCVFITPTFRDAVNQVFRFMKYDVFRVA